MDRIKDFESLGQERRERILAERTQVLERMRKVVDGFTTDYQFDLELSDVRVDEELREPIATLLSMGINTCASCWGHPERRDEKQQSSARESLLPYIGISGYLPGDGENEKGEAVGYTKEQVDNACVRAEKSVHIMRTLLSEHYRHHPEITPTIKINFWEGFSSDFQIESTHKKDMGSLSRVEQDRLITEARTDWKIFLDSLQKLYREDMDTTYVPIPYK